MQVSSGGSGGSRSRASSNKPPPGAVNLERSYQICQAVIQNSPNRDQLRCQLKPPPSLLAANNNSSSGTNKKSDNSNSSRAATQYGVVTSSRNGNGPNNSVSGKPFTPPLPAPGSYPVVPGSNGVSMAKPLTSMGGQGKVTSSRGGAYHQRQQSPPVVVRHVFTSSQGIPVTMAVLPQSQAPPEVSHRKKNFTVIKVPNKFIFLFVNCYMYVCPSKLVFNLLSIFLVIHDWKRFRT